MLTPPSGKGRFKREQGVRKRGDRKMRNGTKREVEQRVTAFDQKFEF